MQTNKVKINFKTKLIHLMTLNSIRYYFIRNTSLLNIIVLFYNIIRYYLL